MSHRPCSVVLGAGLMGRLLAWRLVKAGHLVKLHEAAAQDAPSAAAHVAAAMLAPLAESAITELPVVRMGIHALQRWPEILHSLPSPVFFQQEGTVILWHRQDAAEAQRFHQLLQRTQSQLPTLAAAQTITGTQLASLEPDLQQRFAQALYLPGEGQLDNRQLLAALLQALQASNVDIHWNSPMQVHQLRPGEPGQPDWVFDCRGLGARAEWAPLRGVRGEVVRLHAPEVRLSRPIRLIHPRYPIYIAPKENDVYVIGATEIESEDLTPVSVRSSLELLSAAYTVHSGFAEARILEMNTQARPTLPDNLPAVHCVSPRLLQINGLYRHGFLIAPAVADCVMEWVSQGSHQQADVFGMSFGSR